ncbi:MAG: hypothetical protein LV481_05020 [Methylacidiphilales bacterium]|nr:hypothetical protein [Candidatus Methylacidiphilales bacterium]
MTLGVGSSFVTGNKAEFQSQRNTKSGVFGGVQDFHWQTFVGKNATFTMDGHALVGNHDYDIKLDYTDPTLGYLRMGYTEFRTWYDGDGGYYPPKNETFQPYESDPYIDRRSAWVEGGLTLPDWPTLSFRYEYDSRIGFMDSTSWGQNSSGAPNTLPPTKNIVPAYLGIDETRNIFQGNIADKVGDTSTGLTLRYELDDTKDSTFFQQDPLNAPGATGSRFVTDYDVEKNDIFNVHGFTETFFDDKVTFSSGFSYSNVDTNIGGSRIYSNAYNGPYLPSYASSAARNSGYLDLNGFGNTNEYVYNLNLMLTPIKNLVIIPAMRFEYDSSDLSDGFLNSATTGPGGFTPEAAATDNWTSSVAESLEIRYTGFRDWSLYASGEWSEDWGNDAWDSEPILDTVNFNQDWDRFCQKYTVGANWYPLAQLNFGVQYYHQIHNYNYNNDHLTTVQDQYPGYLQDQDIKTDDMNIRATWQALSNVALVTRYDFQYQTIDTTSDPFVTGSPVFSATTVQSAVVTNHILSENATWTPLPRLYLQVGGSYVINTVDTPAAGLGGGGPTGYNNVLLDGENNYYTIDASVGYAIDDKTNLQLQYDYYRADDYYNNAGSATTAAAATANTNVGLPYGADTEEHNLTATLTHQINKSLEVSLKYGFSKYSDGSTGGQDNYTAQIVYASVKYGF